MYERKGNGFLMIFFGFDVLCLDLGMHSQGIKPDPDAGNEKNRSEKSK